MNPGIWITIVCWTGLAWVFISLAADIIQRERLIARLTRRKCDQLEDERDQK